MTPKAKHDAITALNKSKGWAIIREQIDKELNVFLNQMSTPPAMTESQLHWMRGVLFASRRFLSIPDALLQQIENDIRLTAPPTQKAATKGQTP